MKTQAWGWLTAAVLAAGLNASYHDGGLEWAHRIANRVEHNTSAVLALATGDADQFLTEATILSARNEKSSCPLTTAWAKVQSADAWSPSAWSWSDADSDHFQALSDREQARVARMAARRVRIEAQIARLRIPSVAFNPVVVMAPRVPDCPRVRLNLPAIPRVKIPAVPVVHIDMPGAGPV